MMSVKTQLNMYLCTVCILLFFDSSAGYPIIKWQNVSAATQHCGGARHQQRFIVQ